jgi:hypothetical protein
MFLMKNLRVENEYVTKKECSTSMGEIKEMLQVIKRSVLNLERQMKPIKVSVLNMERQMGIYADMFKTNKWDNLKLAKRVNIVEKHTGIKPEEDLLVSGY